MDEYRIEIAEVPCPRTFAEIRRECIAIGGRTRFGAPRLRLEWGGTARRPFGNQESCKFGWYAERVVTGYFFEGDPHGKTKRDRMGIHFEGDDLAQVPDHTALFSDGRLRVFRPVEAVIDHPIPHWFFTDYLSPAQSGGGAGYRAGYWNRIWHCYEPSRKDWPIPYYRDPDAGDLTVIAAYWHERMEDVRLSGCDIDDPATGSGVEIQQEWMNRAVKHLREETHGQNVESCIPILETYLKEAAEGHRPFVDLGSLGASNG